MGKRDKVSSGSPFRFSAGLYNDLVDLTNPPVVNTAGDTIGVGQMRVVVTVKNTTANDRSRFDCMSLGDLRFAIGAEGKESIIYDCGVADPDKHPAILQGPIAAGKLGKAAIFGYTLAKVAIAAAATELTAAPNAAGHNLLPGSGHTNKLLAAPSTSAIKLLPVILGAGGGSSDTTFIYELTADMTTTGINAKIYSMEDLEEFTGALSGAAIPVDSSARVINTLEMFSDQVTGHRGACLKQGDRYYAIQAPSTCDIVGGY